MAKTPRNSVDYTTGPLVQPTAGKNKAERKPKEGQEKVGTASACLEEIARFDKQFEKWTKRGKEIVDRYRDERNNETQTSRNFNILWSNVQILQPTLYARAPKAEVVRRFKDQDPVARIACEISERATDVEIEACGLHDVLDQCVNDRLLPGRAQAWVSYDPKFKGPAPEEGEPDERVKDGERICVEYVDWRDFGHSPVPTWQQVKKVWRWKYFDKSSFIDRFGKTYADKVEFSDRKNKDTNEPENKPEARVAEVWDLDAKKVYWVSKAVPDYLDEYDDPLHLEKFFPCPRPLYATKTNNTLVPVPDFYLYQDQANEVDKLTGRINRLTDALKIVGVYDQSVKELQTLLAPRGVADNTLVPVDMADLTGKGSLQQAVQLVDISTVITTITACYEARQRAIQVIYEITGISDVIRGATDPNETAEAQRLKAQNGGTRIRKMQADVASFSRDIIRIMAELIVEMYDPMTLWEMTNAESFVGVNPQTGQPNVKLFAAALKLLKNDKLRSFRVDIETDSTIALDESEGKQDATEYLTAMTGMLDKAGQMMAAAPYLGPMVREMVLFGARRFKVGRTMEATIEQAFDQAAEAAKQPKPPSPEQIKAQADQQKAQAQIKLAEVKGQIAMAQGQQKIQLEREKAQLDAQIKVWEAQQELEQSQREFEQDRQQDAIAHRQNMAQSAQAAYQKQQLAKAKPANGRAA